MHMQLPYLECKDKQHIWKSKTDIYILKSEDKKKKKARSSSEAVHMYA